MALECTGGEITLQEIITNVNINTLKETNIAHPLVETAVPVGAVFTDTVKNKNILINGDFAVNQQYGMVSLSTTTNNWSYFADLFSYGCNGSGNATLSHGYIGYSNSIKVTVDEVSAEEWWSFIYYVFEGQDLYSEQGKDITISFKFKTSKVGKYSVVLINVTGDNKESYVSDFEIITANVAQDVSITVPIKTTWMTSLQDDSNVGFSLSIGALGDTESVAPTVDQWVSGYYIFSDEAVNWADTVNGYIEIADVQVERGNVATEFERIPYGDQLARVQRYYEILPNDIGGSDVTTGHSRLTWHFATTKRDAPIYTGTVTGSLDYLNSSFISAYKSSTGYAQIVGGAADARL